VDEALPVSDGPGSARADAEPGATGSAEQGEPAVAWPEPIIVPWWRWRVWIAPATWALSLAAFVILVLLMALAIAAGFFIIGLVEAFGLTEVAKLVANVAGIVVVAVLSAMALRRVMRGTSARLAAGFAARVPIDAPARAFMMAELAEGGPPRVKWSGARAGRWIGRVREGRHARAYLSEPLGARTSRYDRTDRPVEPESIGGGMARGDLVRAMALAFLGTALLWMRGWNVITVVCGIGLAVIAYRMIRRRAMFAPVVAGAGWVQHGAARWTVEDSVLVATGRASARVRLVGPPGVLVLRLRTARHRDFETLWTRWMHPEPKPEQPAFDA
jgi:hypothetical protein